jgi:hypothetical protein
MLTPAQLGALCDWWVDVAQGGYGVLVQCTMGSETIADNQMQCVQAISFDRSCQWTVGQFEACVESMIPSHGCNFGASSCTEFFNCIRADQ